MNAAYKNMVGDTDHPYCWCCGRPSSDPPVWWSGPFLIERAHIVNKPRSEDRRAVILLCSLCHRIQHGEIHREVEYAKPYPAITLANMLWLKWKYDRDFFDLGFLRSRSVQELPKKEIVHRRYRNAFKSRQPFPGLPEIPWKSVLRNG